MGLPIIKLWPIGATGKESARARLEMGIINEGTWIFFSLYIIRDIYGAVHVIHLFFFSLIFPLPTSFFTRSRAADTSELVHLRPFPYHLCEWKAYLKRRNSECQRIQMQDTRRHPRLACIFCPFPFVLFLICFFFPFSLFPFNALSHKRGGGERLPVLTHQECRNGNLQR